MSASDSRPEVDNLITVAPSTISDLFGEEMFGDELMDMYSSVCVAESGIEAIEFSGVGESSRCCGIVEI